MADEKVIDRTSPIPYEEVKTRFSEIAKFPTTLPLLMLMGRVSNHDSYRSGEDMKSYIYSAEKSGLDVSLQLVPTDNGATLNIYNYGLENLPPPNEIIYTNDRLAQIYAGPKKMGIWCYGQGHETKNVIKINVDTSLVLPSPKATWLFESLKWISMVSSEHCPDLQEQSSFWTGSKERPD